MQVESPRAANRLPLGGRRVGARELLLNGGHLLVLSSFAFAQPIYADLTADFFIAFRAQPVDVVAVALILLLVPALLLWGLELVVSRVAPRLLRPLHLVLVAALAGVAVMQLLVSSSYGARLALGVLAGLAAGVLYWRAAPARAFLTALLPAPVLFLAYLLVIGPVAGVVVKGAGDPPLQYVHARTPVVLVTFDEFPAISLMDARRRVDPRLYPNFARLARGSYWFRNATTVHDVTRWAVPAIMTGTRPAADSIPTAADHPQSVFTLLGRRYRLNVSEAYTEVCPRKLCPERATDPFGTRLEALLKNIGYTAARRYLPGRLAVHFPPAEQFRPLDPSAQATAFTRGMRGGARPSLNFMHVLLPHLPWHYLPSGKRYPTDFEPEAGWTSPSEQAADRWLSEQQYQRHLLQAGYADRILGEVLRGLHERRLYDRALVIVVADHGISVRPGVTARFPVRSDAEDILSVPFFVKLPGQRRGRTSNRLVDTADVLPTIADVLGVRLSWRSAGRSVFARAPDRRRLTIGRAGSPPLTVDAADFVRRRDRSLRRKVALFGSDGGPPGVWGIGPDRRLLGRPAHPAGKPAGGVELDHPERFASVDPGSGVVPARVGGRLTGVAPGQPLAVAVAGRVRATTFAYASGRGGVSFIAMVPDRAFRRGRNDVRVLAIERSGGGLRLAPLGS